MAPYFEYNIKDDFLNIYQILPKFFFQFAAFLFNKLLLLLLLELDPVESSLLLAGIFSI